MGGEPPTISVSILLNSNVMKSLHDNNHLSIDDQAHLFAEQFAVGGPDFLTTHLPEQFIVGAPTGSQLVTRERFIEAAQQRADLVTNTGLDSPELVSTGCQELGDAYCLIIAQWQMMLPTGERLDLMEDFLIDRTGSTWICLVYLLRQDLPKLIKASERQSS